MHKSIKSYFTVISKKKGADNPPDANTKKKRDLSFDEDVEKSSPKKRQKHNIKKLVLSDSEEQIAVVDNEIKNLPSTKKTKLKRKVSEVKVPKKLPESVKRSTKRRVLSDSEDEVVERRKAPSSKKNKKELQNIVSAAHVFDTRPVKRIEAPQPSKKLSQQDAEFFFDEKFEAVLDQLEKSDCKKAKPGKTNGNATNIVSHEIGSTKTKKSTHRLSNSDKLINDEISGCNENTGIKTNTKSNGKEKEKVMKNHSETPQSSKTDTLKAAESNKKMSNDIPYKKGISKLVIEKQNDQKKRKRSSEDQESDPYEEMIQKKKRGHALYQQYLHRGGARNPGSKEIPTGAKNCLAGQSFVITGVLDSLERDEADELIKKYGGRIVAQVSKKTNYMVLGDEPGPAKLEKAKKFGIKTISENDLLDMIRTRPAGQATSMTSIKSPRNRAKRKTPEPKPLTIALPGSPPKDKDRSHPISKLPEKDSRTLTTDESPAQVSTSCENETRAWVEKYKPKSMKQIIGQQGDKSNAHKLYNWLQNWQKNQCGNVKHTRPSSWAQHDGSFFKAALLSGPPGVGKTTTVQVVCEALELDALEFNASDTRSKRLLKEEVSELLNNKSMKGYFVDSHSKKPDLNHVLVMDEVDGMAGNEDRGGLQELISLIKTTNVPVICICNDRNHPKMKTLSNYTYDLRFQKPRIEQIRGAMMSICFKEGINITAEDLNRLIESTNNDIRQVLNHLSLFAENSTIERSQQRRVNKDLKLGPWDVVGKVFSAEAHKTMSIHDKSDLFFHDYNISSLFVQENYLGVSPNCPKNKVLEMVADSAESLALGDLVENAIRKTGAWSLLPTQACYSSVIPGTLMSGHMTKQITFPAWLGQNSRRGKFDRLLQEITIHTRLSTAASKDSINLDYLKHLRDAVVRPLVVDGPDGTKAALDVMSHYHLLREDLDSLIEVSLWPGQRDPMQALESKVKAAFTRAFNKSSIMRPYALKKGTEKKRKSDDTNSENFSQSDAEEPESEEDDDLSTDPMIKLKKPITSVKETAGAKKKTSKPGNGKSKVLK